jgi:hypothetical protein
MVNCFVKLTLKYVKLGNLNLHDSENALNFASVFFIVLD